MSHALNRHNPHSIPGPHFQAELPRVELEIIRGRARNKLRRLREATYLFGSGQECDLVLGDPQFPEVHGYLLVTPEGVSIRHLGLEPLLTVEGTPVTSTQLKHNDRIRTGPFEFRLHVRWARGSGPLHMPREVVSSVGARRIDSARQEVAGLLDDIEAELAVDQRKLRLFVGSDPPRRTADAEAGRAPAPHWPHLSRHLAAVGR